MWLLTRLGLFPTKTPVVAEFARTEAPLTPAGRGTYAAQALNNPVISEAFSEIEREAMIVWKDTPGDAYDTREFLWRYIKAVSQVKGRLERYIADAKIAEYNTDMRSGSRTGNAGNQARPTGNQE